MDPLEDESLQAAVAKLPGWSLGEQGLRREIVFRNFQEALDFVNKVGAVAEEVNHHPDIDIRYNRVTLTLMTHDIGGITTKDVDMALRLDRNLTC
jgi:4a-hydroxytetrahydrobiopterin dehydratase